MLCTRTRTQQFSVAIAATVVAIAGCSDGSEVATSSVAAATTESTQPFTPTTPTTPSSASMPPADTATVLPFVDEFDTDVNGWGGPFQRFEDGAYVWDLPSGQRDVRSADSLIDVEDEIDSVVITTEFSAVGVDAVGIQCAYEEIGGSSRWYQLELRTDQAVIRRQPTGTNPVEQLAANNTVTLTGQPTELVGECWRETDGYHLRLLVDGTLAVEATDSQPFGRAGAPNLSAQAMPTSADVTEHVVRFDRFEVTVHPAS